MLPPSPADPQVGDLLAARPHLSMHASDGLLLEGVPLQAVADSLGTPAWVLGAGTIRTRLARLTSAFAELPAHVHYAVKAHDHLAVLDLMRRGGAGADVVSLGEFARARAAGIAAADIVFSGVGKQPAELQRALAEGVGQINVESAAELDMLAQVAAGLGVTAPVVLRVNPDVDAGTHGKITTGRARDKFGIPAADIPTLYARAAAYQWLSPVGLALHLGSQILTAPPYRNGFAVLAGLIPALRDAGHVVSRIDCGGGLGITYRDEIESSPELFASLVRRAFGALGVTLIIEPGRWLVGPAGLLLATVVLTKHAGGRLVTVLDGAMNDLIRPALYGAWHGIVPLSAIDALGTPVAQDVVGPICESGDTFAYDRLMQPLQAGARVAILDAGAYGSVMSSTYNGRPLAPIAWIDNGGWTVIRPRQPVESLWAGEVVP